MSRPADLSALAQCWTDALAAWAIPPHIVDAATRDPWMLPVLCFSGRADRAVNDPAGVSFERAAEALRENPGSVLDVGAGAGAASLPLAAWATTITAVDGKAPMLEAFAERAAAAGVDHREVLGSWPAAAADVVPHDVVVVHHVVYNVADIVPFLGALDAKAKRRVVLELPPHHPLSWMNPLWKQFHGVDRPVVPIAGDLVEILGAMDVADLRTDYWQQFDPAAADGSDSESLDERSALVAQRLCLSEAREPDVAAALTDIDPGYHRDVVTISWTPGSASRNGTHR
ncbi:MAG: methyltransferase domain-containing protein [Actinomycetia bacterium]|nr:methyltransferase domain-containing protein [Actinomycetes bacterium]